MQLVQILSETPAVLLVFAALLGLLFGSFFNVVIHRVPIILENDWKTQCSELLQLDREEESPALSLWRPRSRCPDCNTPIGGFDNIPILSYMLLGGKCRQCRTLIAFRYPLVELLSGVLFLLVALKMGFSQQAGAAMVLTGILIPLGFIDLDHQILPDGITLPGIWLGLTVNLFEIFTTLESAVIGAALGYMTLWLVFQAFRVFTGKEGMGYGDFKLLALLGAWLGWQLLPLIIILSAVSGAIIGVCWLVLKQRDKDTPIPFGPYLCVAGWIALIWGHDLTDIYLRFAGLS